jgi:hypothetical protein
MGCRRAGFYSIDFLDNAGHRSAREVHPELAKLEVGQIIPATPDGDEGFEVLRIDAPRALLLGGLFDSTEGRQRAFAAPRPDNFWQVTWAFVLEPFDPSTTRLHVRARAAFPRRGRLHAAAIRPVHRLMQSTMLRHLAERVEDRSPHEDITDVIQGVHGMSLMVAAFLSPFSRPARSHWGLTAEIAARPYPGDELVKAPRWSWSHGVIIEAPCSAVWPWLAQIGADRGGFYSYQWLQNVAGCDIENAERIHDEWLPRVGQKLMLHPDRRVPALEIRAVEPGRYLLTEGKADERARAEGRPWTQVSWLFFLEPLGESRCRFVSRYRADCSDDVATKLAFGPTLLEPVGFAMDGRMLLGVKERVERLRTELPNFRAAEALPTAAR